MLRDGSNTGKTKTPFLASNRFSKNVANESLTNTIKNKAMTKVTK